jgi:hypothetical protein
VITGRPDLRTKRMDGSEFYMPNYQGKEGRTRLFDQLSSQDITDVVGLLASWRKGNEVSRK